MSRFAQYYLEYLKDELFSEYEWSERQKHFGAYFESDVSIDFTLGEGEGRKTYKHNVYHLSLNKDIVVMRIANDKSLCENFCRSGFVVLSLWLDLIN